MFLFPKQPQQLPTNCVQLEMTYANTLTLFFTDRLLCSKGETISGFILNGRSVACPQSSCRRHVLQVLVPSFTQVMKIFTALLTSLNFTIPVPSACPST